MAGPAQDRPFLLVVEAAADRILVTYLYRELARQFAAHIIQIELMLPSARYSS